MAPGNVALTKGAAFLRIFPEYVCVSESGIRKGFAGLLACEDLAQAFSRAIGRRRAKGMPRQARVRGEPGSRGGRAASCPNSLAQDSPIRGPLATTCYGAAPLGGVKSLQHLKPR